MHNWPALIFGLVLTFYWGRVVRLVYKVRRATGRSANFAPVEPLGMVLRVVWYPTVAVWIVHPYLVAVGATRGWLIRPIWSHPAIAWPAAVVAVAALAATMLCWKRMGRSWRMGINPGEKTQLIVTGPFAYVRHPIYALSSLLMLATLVAIPSPLMLAAAILHLGLLRWEAAREEKYLVLHHGEGYADYCRHVGRFLPRSYQPYQPSAPA